MTENSSAGRSKLNSGKSLKALRTSLNVPDPNQYEPSQFKESRNKIQSTKSVNPKEKKFTFDVSIVSRFKEFGEKFIDEIKSATDLAENVHQLGEFYGIQNDFQDLYPEKVRSTLAERYDFYQKDQAKPPPDSKHISSLLGYQKRKEPLLPQLKTINTVRNVLLYKHQSSSFSHKKSASSFLPTPTNNRSIAGDQDFIEAKIEAKNYMISNYVKRPPHIHTPSYDYKKSGYDDGARDSGILTSPSSTHVPISTKVSQPDMEEYIPSRNSINNSVRNQITYLDPRIVEVDNQDFPLSLALITQKRRRIITEIKNHQGDILPFFESKNDVQREYSKWGEKLEVEEEQKLVSRIKYNRGDNFKNVAKYKRSMKNIQNQLLLLNKPTRNKIASKVLDLFPGGSQVLE